MKCVKLHGSTRDQGTRTAQVRRNPPWLLKTAILESTRPKSLHPGSPALHLATDPGPEGGPTPAAPTAAPAAPATLPEATAEVDGGEEGHALAAARTAVTEVAVGLTVGVTPGVALTHTEGDPGLTPTIATQVEVAVEAADEDAIEVTATGAQSIPGRTVPPAAVRPGDAATAAAVATAENPSRPQSLDVVRKVTPVYIHTANALLEHLPFFHFLYWMYCNLSLFTSHLSQG